VNIQLLTSRQLFNDFSLTATVWRTSTPEPTRGDGIIWTYIKDVTRYTPLFNKQGTFILQLDNLIQPGLDGIYSSKASSVDERILKF